MQYDESHSLRALWPRASRRASALMFCLALILLGAESASAQTSYFDDVTSLSFPPAPCGDPADPTAIGCYTNWLLLSDIDGDDDLDILFANGGGYYVPGKAEPSLVYLNDGSGGFRDATATSFSGATSRLRQVSVGDIDGDGDRDIYQPGGYGLDLDKLWVQTAPGVFEDRAMFYLPGTLKSRAGASHFGDLDGDGDLDLAVADWGEVPRGSPAANTSKGNTWIYLNDGHGMFSQLPASAVPAPILPTVGRTPIDLDFADVDGDFDLDILVNHRNGQSRIFLNDGHAKFTDGTTDNYPIKKGPYVYNQELCDFDEDGDLDMLLDNSGNRIQGQGNFSQVLVNDGHGHFVDETLTRITGEPGGDDNAVKCADVNGDGHYDLLVATLTVASEKLLLNDGSAHFNYVPDALPSTDGDPTLGIDAADLDGDDILDIVTGQGEGDVRVDRIFKGAGLSKPDVTPPKFRAIEQITALPGSPIVIRLGVVDAITSETGEHVASVSLSYSVDGGAPKSVPATFIGGDLFRAVIPAQPNGTLLNITPKSVDRAGTPSAAAPFELLVGTIVIPDAGVEDAGEPDAEIDAGVAEPDAASEEPDAGTETDAGLDEPDAMVEADSAVQPEPEPDAASVDAATSEDEEDDEEEDEEEEPVEDAGSGNDAGGSSSSDDGCSVRAPGASNGRSGLLALLGLALFVQRRRRNTR